MAALKYCRSFFGAAVLSLSIFWAQLLVNQADEVSMCSSDIYMGGNPIPTKFFVESYTELSSTTRDFCEKHFILQTECDLIKSHHWKRCFPSNLNAADHHIDDRERNIHQANVFEGDDVSTRQSDQKHEKRESKIDYSATVGPTLPVTHLEETRNLQAYAGESVTQTMIRFCGSLKLNADMCKQVEEAYLNLLESSSAVNQNNDGSDNVKNDMDMNGGDAKSKTKETIDAGVYSTAKNLASLMVTNFQYISAKYWSYFLLFVAFVYVYLTQHQ